MCLVSGFNHAAPTVLFLRHRRKTNEESTSPCDASLGKITRKVIVPQLKTNYVYKMQGKEIKIYLQGS